MHQCEEFRERIAEHIIDREDILRNAEFQRELLICSSCAEFYAESREIMEALSAVDLSVSEDQWAAIGQRLRTTLINEAHPLPLRAGAKLEHDRAKLKKPVRVSTFARLRSLPRRAFDQWPAVSPGRGVLLAAAAMLLLTAGLYRLVTPLVNATRSPAAVMPQGAFIERSVLLDPVTLDFLEESELLLRNVMKITPNDMDDLADAKKVAGGQLADIEQRKEAAADVPPVIDVMDTYETVLRDIRHVDEQSAAEDIADIQARIRKNGLIANIKSFQPAVRPVSFDGR